MAGFYPKPLTAAGHDGLWYWTQARTMTAQKERWNAWLYYQQAESLLRPANFVQSTHLEKLKTEASAAAPPAVVGGRDCGGSAGGEGAGWSGVSLYRTGRG